jgi:gliding motility-associated-like protein
LSSASISNPIAAPADTTIYKVKVFSEFGCSDTASVAINIWKKPVANAGPDKRILEGQSVPLEGTADGTQVIYSWSPANTLDNSSDITPVARPVDNTTYTLRVVSQLGCGASTDDVFVRVFKEVKIPNAFSPNGDGINDDWKIINLITYPEATLQVFNRHGQKVYESRGYNSPWKGTYNGSPLPIGTYYYVIDLKTEFFPRLSGWVFIAR